MGQLQKLPPALRPRERALQYGVQKLSFPELLAIILRTGNRQKNALELASQLLETFSDLRSFSQASLEELKAIHGIGEVKALELMVCFEIAKRLNEEEVKPGKALRSSEQVYLHYRNRLRNEKKEKFFIVLLNTKQIIIREELISIGSLNFTIVHPREVFHTAIREAASSLVLIHNHPTGDPQPSKEDLAVTKRLMEVGRVVGIEILDHIIIGDSCYYSFLEHKLI